LIAFGIVSEEEVRISVRPLGRSIIDVAAKRSRCFATLADVLDWIVKPDRAPYASVRWLLDSDSIRYVFWDLMDDQLETKTNQNRVVLIAVNALKAQRFRVEGRDPL
jgi:hypothetical protein